MKTATKATKITLSLANVVCRILFFYFFWLASVDGNGELQNRQFAFINEMWAWEQYPFTKIQIYTTQCPDDWIVLSSLKWPGTVQHYDSNDLFVPSQASRTFTKWTTNEYKQPFLLCGYQIKHNVIENANQTQTCQERGMKDCGIQNMFFCIDNDTECPINSFQFELSESGISVTTTNIDSLQQMPVSLIRIDSYTPCATRNSTNTRPQIEYDENLDEAFLTCTDLDKEYIEINTITDDLYFQINEADDVIPDTEGTKSLYYKPYPFWNQTCNGDLFLIAKKQSETLSNYRNVEFINFVFVVIYLILCNYTLPTIPYLLRCIRNLNQKIFVYLDYFIRVLLSAFMTYLSFVSLNYSQALLDSLDELWGYNCIKDEETVYDRFAYSIETQRALDIVAITFSFVLWAIEGSLLWILGCQETIKQCRRGYKRLKIKKEVVDTYDNTSLFYNQ